MKSRRALRRRRARLPSTPLRALRSAAKASYFMFGKADLSEYRYGVFTQSCHALSRRHTRARHAERQIHHFEAAPAIFHLRQRAAMRNLRIGQCLRDRAIGRSGDSPFVERGEAILG